MFAQTRAYSMQFRAAHLALPVLYAQLVHGRLYIFGNSPWHYSMRLESSLDIRIQRAFSRSLVSRLNRTELNQEE